MSFDKIKYDNEYKRANYAEMHFLIPKAKREIVKKTAEELGVSVSRLVVNALETTYHIDLSK